MALATRTERRPSPAAALWRSTVGKKAVMAVTGVAMLLYLVAHMLGNLKIFFGATDFNGYAGWLRTIGEPVLHHGWFLWLVRAGLLAAVVLHGVAAYQLSRRDRAARPAKYAHRRQRASYATRTMRWGGVILALFLVWHILDLTTLTVNPRGQAHHPYENIVADFRNWYADVFYIVAMLALGLHIRHGFWSAAQTLGANNARRDRALKAVANVLALLLTCGFIAVPVAVMTGVVS
ncbi:succinate dehydrogenase cytochrome b subunit [Streptomyces sp. SPB162]|uniref:succinate dehydrogenase cytochrome b subunit n=1 Tax=Streptomyces sp. SPB162 TaxID=2940560 RepID=UPI002406656D|nr:succinate dehydrogenase cytochrome b subunit [Streptomyces sp. SPB162]MDF9812612.1 succinate dehydrogenase / fumarate reductase cytochrome b subunit [Streptomyces sp. SPB162]